MRRLLPALLALALLSCGGNGDSAKDRAASRGPKKGPPPIAAPAGRPEAPPPIDPDREEEIRTGSPAERLLAKYELLVERILIERKENVFSADRTVDHGLIPLAKEHHRLLEEGTIDTTLTLEFARLAEFVLASHILSEQDPHGVKARSRIDHVRGMIPAHERPPTP
ncbi:MAG: hypothetical protein ABIH26_16045 [Candidatus Eisenbacteria bacterium]